MEEVSRTRSVVVGSCINKLAISLDAGKHDNLVFKLLELGRCIINGLLLEMQIEISLLKQQLRTRIIYEVFFDYFNYYRCQLLTATTANSPSIIA
jgi:hypothetical protein